MNVTHDMGTWCDLCNEYISAKRPAAVFLVRGTFARICLECLREATEACKEAESVVRGARE